MVTIWIVIKQFQNCSRMLQNSSRSPRIAQEPSLQPGYYSRNSTRTSKATDRVLFTTQYQNTVQSYYSEKQGDRTLFTNSDRYCLLNSALTESLKLLFTFGWKEIHPRVKAVYLPWFPQSPVWINSTELSRTSPGRIKVFQLQIPSWQTFFPVSNNLAHDS